MADIIRAGSLWGFSQLTRSLGHDPRPLLAFGGSRNHRDGIAYAIQYGSLHPLSPQQGVVRRASEGLLE